jgi:NAD(P)-dependent dehydrogenase (short-subunit alcohol dehydrogenase family)
MAIFSPRGRTALVTGGARRVGRAIAEALAREGADILLHYRESRGEAEEAASALRASGARAELVQADLADPPGLEAFWARALAAAPRGRIEILVNSASIFPEDTLSSFSFQELERSLRVNALAPLLLSRQFAASLESSGVIVNLVDARMSAPMRRHASYQASKLLLADLTRLLARELAPRVRVNAVAPGLVLPPEGLGEEARRRLQKLNLLGRWGEPHDVARAVLFLVENDFVTGQLLYIDGGGTVMECLNG